MFIMVKGVTKKENICGGKSSMLEEKNLALRGLLFRLFTYIVQAGTFAILFQIIYNVSPL